MITSATEQYWRGRNVLRVQDSAADCLEREEDLFCGLGLGGRTNDVGIVDKDFQQVAVLMELGDYRKTEAVRTTRERSALYLQAIIRGWLARKRYLAHRRDLKELLKRLKHVRENEAATTCQTQARQYLAKRLLHHLQQEADRRREEEAKRKKKGAKKKQPFLLNEMTRAERLLAMDEVFLLGWDQWKHAMNPQMNKVLHVAPLEDAIKIWEKARNHQDKVMLRMIEIAHRFRYVFFAQLMITNVIKVTKHDSRRFLILLLSFLILLSFPQKMH